MKGPSGRLLASACGILLLLGAVSCRGPKPAAGTIVVLLENSPNNLDLRQGTDASSEQVGALIFDSLVKKDEHFNLKPWLATSWEQPDPLTWVFHLRDGVRFQDGRPLEAADVVWTIESLIDSKVAGLITAKGGAFAHVDRAEARDRLTVVVHMKQPDAGLLFNMSDGLFGVVPRGSRGDFGLHPVGSGPYRFVSQVQDKDVVLERWDGCWSAQIGDGVHPPHPGIRRLQFNVVPDTITSALELQKGSADAASDVLTPDMVYALRDSKTVQTTRGPGANVWYLNFNVADPVLNDRRVRQAVALAIDKPALVSALWRGNARLADSMLPLGHWAAADATQIATYPYDPARAIALLESAGYHAGAKGVRLELNLKISTDETIRLLAVALQQQFRKVGIDLTIRSAEFGTFYADVTRGLFQMYILHWLGSNQDPDIFRYMYSSQSFPPRGANRGHYVNPRIDELLAKAATETGSPADIQAKRRREYVEVQKILSEDEPSVPLWFPDNVVMHSARVRNVFSEGEGNFDFLR